MLALAELPDKMTILFMHGVEYVTMTVPNIVDISYGRGVGYTFTQHDLGDDVHNISATKIRKKMREDGTL